MKPRAIVRRLLVVAGLLCVFVALLAGSSYGGNATNSQLTRVTLRLDYFVLGMHAPFYLGLEKGFYRAHGLDLTIKEGTGSNVTALLVGSGQDTFGLADSATVALSIGQGVPDKVIFGLMQKGGQTLVSKQQEGITSPADLVGKTIGLTPGEATLLLLPAFLSINHVDPTQVHVVALAPAAHIPALLGGTIDLTGGSVWGNGLMLQAQYPDQKFNFLNFSDHGVNLMGYGLITTPDEISRHPKVVAEFVAATTESIQYALKHKVEAVNNLIKQFPVHNNPADIEFWQSELQVLPSYLHTKLTQNKPLGWMSVTDWSNMLTLLIQHGGLPNYKRTPSEYYTNAFVQGGPLALKP